MILGPAFIADELLTLRSLMTVTLSPVMQQVAVGILDFTGVVAGFGYRLF